MSLPRRFRALLFLASLSPSFAAAAPAAYEIDSAHSSVQFVVTHLGVARFTGRFDRLQGNFGYDPAHIDKSSAHLTVPANSIDTALEPRDERLRGDNFFAVTQYPTISFDSKSVSGNDSQFALSGVLVLLGVSRPVVFQVRKIGESRDPWGGYRAGFEATATIKRSDFGMRFMLGAVADDVAVTVYIEGLRKK